MSNSNLYIVEVSKLKREEDLYVIEILEKWRNPLKTKTCPYCGDEAVFLSTLGRYYCFNCKRYV